MAKSRSRRDANLRRHIAYLAARLMAEDGVGDYATAKQKAARQAGLADANLLPDNTEIGALRESRLWKDEQPARLRSCSRREGDARVRRFPARARQMVLSGTAGQFSDVNLAVRGRLKGAHHIPVESPLSPGGFETRSPRRAPRRGAADQLPKSGTSQ
jgi:hypothetical protein